MSNNFSSKKFFGLFDTKFFSENGAMLEKLTLVDVRLFEYSSSAKSLTQNRSQKNFGKKLRTDVYLHYTKD